MAAECCYVIRVWYIIISFLGKECGMSRMILTAAVVSYFILCLYDQLQLLRETADWPLKVIWLQGNLVTQIQTRSI